MAWRHFARRSRPPDRHDRRHRRPRRKPVGPPERAASGGTKRRGLDSSPQARLPGRLHATRPHVLGASVPQRLRWPCRQVPEASRRGLVFRQREGRKSLTSTVPRNYRPSSRAPGSPRHRTAQGRRAPARARSGVPTKRPVGVIDPPAEGAAPHRSSGRSALGTRRSASPPTWCTRPAARSRGPDPKRARSASGAAFGGGRAWMV
jgi:hypothetical protein